MKTYTVSVVCSDNGDFKHVTPSSAAIKGSEMVFVSTRRSSLDLSCQHWRRLCSIEVKC